MASEWRHVLPFSVKNKGAWEWSSRVQKRLVFTRSCILRGLSNCFIVFGFSDKMKMENKYFFFPKKLKTVWTFKKRKTCERAIVYDYVYHIWIWHLENIWVLPFWMPKRSLFPVFQLGRSRTDRPVHHTLTFQKLIRFALQGFLKTWIRLW